MKSLFLSLFFLVMPLSAAFGQKNAANDGPVGIFNSRSEYHEFMGNAKRVAYGEGGSPELQAMIPMLNDIALNQPIGQTAGQYNTEATTLGMLADKNVRREIEMVDDQYKELQQLGREVQKRSGEQLLSLDFSDRAKLFERIREMQANSQKELDGVLLPHQIARLRQIQFQSQLRRKSLVGILTSDPVKSNLEITDDQSEELREAEKEIAAEMEEEIKKLREKAKQKLLSRLKPQQKKEVEEMIGDTYDFPASEKSRTNGRKGKTNAGAKKDWKK